MITVAVPTSENYCVHFRTLNRVKNLQGLFLLTIIIEISLEFHINLPPWSTDCMEARGDKQQQQLSDFVEDLKIFLSLGI